MSSHGAKPSQLGTQVCGPQALTHSPDLAKALGSSVLMSVDKKPNYISVKQRPSEAAGWERFWPTPCSDLGSTRGNGVTSGS